jgi:hypothetical protein
MAPISSFHYKKIGKKKQLPLQVYSSCKKHLASCIKQVA